MIDAKSRAALMSCCLYFLSCSLLPGKAGATTNFNANTKSAEPAPQADLTSLNAKRHVGDTLLQRGYYQDAIGYFRGLAKQYHQSNDAGGEAGALFNLAEAQRAIGMFGPSVRSLEVALQRIKSGANRALEARILSSLAAAYLYGGKPAKAKPLLVDAKTKAALLNDTGLEAMILNDQGNMYALERKPAAALQAYKLSVYLADKAKAPLVAIRAQTNAALVRYSQQNFAQSKRDVSAALLRLQQQPPSYDKAYAAAKLGELAQKLLSHEQAPSNELALAAVNALKPALTAAVQLANKRLTSQILGVLAGIYRIGGQTQQALQLNEKAIFDAQQANAQDLLYKWEWQAGRLEKNMGNLDKAIRYYRFAKNALQPIRRELTQRSIGDDMSFRESQGGVYLELADLLLQKSSTVKDRKKLTGYLLEARDTVESQKVAELQDYFKDSCTINSHSRQTLIDEALAKNTAVIYPILLSDRTELLVSYSDGIQRYTTNKSEEQVTRQVRNLRVKLEKRRTRDYLPAAEALYKWLIKPMEADFQRRKINTLVVVSDQALRTIPLSALYDGKQFLISKYAIATSPGLKMTDPAPFRRNNLKVLISGLSEPVQGFPALQYVEGELEEIKDLYVGELLMNRDFVTSSISSALQDPEYSVAHIASHSVFSGDVAKSYILTYDNRITVDQLGRYAARGRSRNKPIELLTLSACQTAAGDDRAALGLAGVAVKSGARSAVATLWEINDQASALLVTEFYRQLQNKHLSKAQALQRAQLKLMRNIRYRHPGYWSPFLLIGNWL